MTDFITIGIVLGLSAGFSPGPLLTLVISETIRHDIKSGIKIAFSPIFTDIPIIILTLTVLAQLSGFKNILGIISILGGAVILFMGYESMNPKSTESDFSQTKPNSLLKGMLVNALSPHPYLFWLSVGGPIINRAKELNAATPLIFIGSFYAMLVGSKILLAILINKSKSFLSSNLYMYIMRLLGMALCLLAILLFREGLKLLGLIN